MLGPEMSIDLDGFVVTLRPMTKSDIPIIAKGMSQLSVRLLTAGMYPIAEWQEEEWLTKTAEDPNKVNWGIEVQEKLIGTTSLEHMTDSGSCTSGIVIFAKDWWQKGVATRAHLARTLFAADFANRFTIKSSARTINPGSFKALERVGYYRLPGAEPRTGYIQGQFIDTYHLVWMNPDRIQVMFPEGVPPEYQDAIAKARIALDKAREVVTVA